MMQKDLMMSVNYEEQKNVHYLEKHIRKQLLDKKIYTKNELDELSMKDLLTKVIFIYMTEQHFKDLQKLFMEFKICQTH